MKITIDLSDKLEYETFKFMLDHGIHEIAGPGNQEHYWKMMAWREIASNPFNPCITISSSLSTFPRS